MDSSTSWSTSIAPKIKNIINESCKENSGKVCGAIICIVGPDGNPVFTHASGRVPKNDNPAESRDVQLEDRICAWSCGKTFATIVALQLVEEGKLDLDDPDMLEQYLPELKAKDRFFSHWTTDDQGVKQPHWKPRQKRITVRMLLNHTSQLSNSMLDEDDVPMTIWYESLHPKQSDDDSYEAFRQGVGKYFFFDEPGNFRYTGGLEWTGILLERLTKFSLADLFQQRVLKPLQMENTKVTHWCEAIPDTSRLLTGHYRLPDGTVQVKNIPPGTTYAGSASMPDFKPFPQSDKHAYAASMSVTTTASDYCKVLAVLLNHGVSPTTGAKVLTRASVDAMVAPQLRPEQFQKRIAGDRTALSIPLDLARLDPNGNMGLACAIQGTNRVMPNGRRGRSKDTAYWYGLGCSDWWIDFEQGIAVFATTQMLPWNDPPWVEMMDEVEAAIYEALE